METENASEVPTTDAEQAAPTGQPESRTTRLVYYPGRISLASSPDTTYPRSIEGILRIASVVSIACTFVDKEMNHKVSTQD